MVAHTSNLSRREARQEDAQPGQWSEALSQQKQKKRMDLFVLIYFHSGKYSWILWFCFFFICIVFACICAYAPSVCLVLEEAIKMHQIHQHWRDRWL